MGIVAALAWPARAGPPFRTDHGFTGVALRRKVTAQFDIGVEVFHQMSPANDVPDSTGFNAGAPYDFSENWHWLILMGHGLLNVAATNQSSYYGALRLTFWLSWCPAATVNRQFRFPSASLIQIKAVGSPCRKIASPSN